MVSFETMREDEAVRVLQHLLTAFDDEEEDLATTAEEVEDRLERDRAYVRKLAGALNVHGDPDAAPPAPQELLAELAALPDVAPEVERAVEEVQRRSTLPLDGETLATIIGIASAVAIIRPRVEFKRSRDGERQESRFLVDVRGTPNLDKIVQILLKMIGK